MKQKQAEIKGQTKSKVFPRPQMIFPKVCVRTKKIPKVNCQKPKKKQYFFNFENPTRVQKKTCGA